MWLELERKDNFQIKVRNEQYLNKNEQTLILIFFFVFYKPLDIISYFFFNIFIYHIFIILTIGPNH